MDFKIKKQKREKKKTNEEFPII